MYLSRLMLNFRNPQVARDLHDICHMHRTVMSVFSDVEVPREARSAVSALYRVELDRRAGSGFVIIQSSVRPDWSGLPGGYALSEAASDREDSSTRSMDKALSRLREGQVLRFRLRANASRKVDTKSGPDGRRHNGRRVPCAWMPREWSGSGERRTSRDSG